MKILGDISHREVFSPLSHKHIQAKGDKILEKKNVKSFVQVKANSPDFMLMPKLLLWICSQIS